MTAPQSRTADVTHVDLMAQLDDLGACALRIKEERDTLRAQNTALRQALNTLLLNFGTVEPGDSVAIDVARAALSQTEVDDK
jgi:hypothetical protein